MSDYIGYDPLYGDRAWPAHMHAELEAQNSLLARQEAQLRMAQQEADRLYPDDGCGNAPVPGAWERSFHRAERARKRSEYVKHRMGW